MSSKIPHLTFIYDRYHKSTSKKKASVEIRITYDYKQKYISTGVMLYPNQWKNNTVVNTPDSIQLNKSLDKLLSEVRQVLYSMAEKNAIDIYAVPNRLEDLHNSKISLYDYCIKRANVRKYGKRKDSQNRYDRFIRLFKKYGKIKSFEDITEDNIIEFDRYLTDKNLKPYSKWNNYHRFLNSFISDAIDEGLLHKNPYKWITIDRGKDIRSLEKHLTPEEFYKLKVAKMSSKCLERIRDLFVFQTYTCLSYRDLKNFNPKNIVEIDGMKVYTGHREKTNKEFTIPMIQPVLDILDKYNYKLPVISNVQYNNFLKVVAQVAGIDKPISTHWARHTGATMLLNEGIDMRIVSKICGHSSTKITERIYAKLLDETVVKAVTNIKDKL